MITVSLCMIVRNEEKVLARCLESIHDLVDEIIIVDTGSEDATKAIAGKYTDRIYDYIWTNDFSQARNYAFSKAKMEYIYSADADEVLDEENRLKFRQLKEVMMPEVEIVQMKYGNQLEYGTTYNYDEEYRPKLFKRLRTFTWIEPIHEIVRIDPVVYDSDIVIKHMPLENHSRRDFSIFRKEIMMGRRLSMRLESMYIRELFLSGIAKDYEDAIPYFESILQEDVEDTDHLKRIFCILTKGAGLLKEWKSFFKYAMKAVTIGSCSEICYELGEYYFTEGDYEEASLWYYNACYETEPIISIKCGMEYPLKKLIDCAKKCENEKMEVHYREEFKKCFGE